MKFFSFLVFFFLFVSDPVWGSDVFDAAWTNCATYNEHCKCAKGETCLVRFGFGDDWVFKQVQGFDIPCTHAAFGLESKKKDDKEFNCFNTTLLSNQTGAPFVTVADQGKKFAINDGPALVRYGVKNKNIWSFGILADGAFSCQDDLLGYFPGGNTLDQKICQVGRTYLQQNQTFAPPLADANKNFSLMLADAIYSVYYGSYIAQIASSTPLLCNADEFGLSSGLLNHQAASCGVLTGSPVAFYNPTGFWRNVETCDDTQSCTFSISEGVTSTTTSSRSTTWQATLSGTVKGGMTFTGKTAVGGDFGGSLTGTVSSSINLMQSVAYSQSVTQACIASCNVSSGLVITLWQWEMVTTEINFDAKNLPLISDQFQTYVCNYLCLPQGSYPQCPPGYCGDKDCQTCTAPIFAENNSQ